MLTAKEIKKIVSTAKTVTVKNMISNAGFDVPNQFIVSVGSITIFQSYHSTVAVQCGNTVLLDNETYDYSRTTAVYRNKFLGCNTAECKQRIASGQYVLTNLN